MPEVSAIHTRSDLTIQARLQQEGCMPFATGYLWSLQIFLGHFNTRDLQHVFCTLLFILEVVSETHAKGGTSAGDDRIG